MGNFSINTNKSSQAFFEDISEYNEKLRQTLTDSVTINNPIGKTCLITFGNLDLNLNFFNLPFQKSPLNYNLFDKFLTTSYLVEDINSSFVKIINDLQCCDLAEKYNSSILPLFMWFIGDAGDRINHPAQYDESRKDNGFLPILIEVAKNLMQTYEPIKNLTCILRPVPGNPWMSAGGMDWLKPIYNTISELDYIMKTILNGDYLDILIEPVKQFRDKLVTCTGRYRGELIVHDDLSDAVDQQLKLKASIEKAFLTMTGGKLDSTTPPVYSDDYYIKLEQLQSITEEVINSLTMIKQYESELAKIKLDKISLNKTKTSYQNKITELNDLIQWASQSDKVKLENELDNTEIQLSNTISNITNLENRMAFLNSELITLKSFNGVEEYNTLKQQVSKMEEEYQVKLTIYMAWYNSNEHMMKKYQDCLLLTRVLQGEKTDNSCNCLLSLMNLFIPLPEIVNISVEKDIQKLLGRLPYTQTEINNLKKNEYVLIKISNLDEKFPGTPTLLYGPSWRNSFNSIAGNVVMSDGKLASEYFQEIDAVSTLRESVGLSEKFLQQKKSSSNKRIKVELELYNILSQITENLENLKLEKTKKLINLINNLGTIQITKDLVTANLNVEKTKLKQELEIIDNFLAYQTYEYFRDNKDLLPEFNFGDLTKIMELEDELEKQKTDTTNWEQLIRLNTRVVTIIGKDNIPCDCSILCKLIQYVVDIIMSAIKSMFDRIVQMILNSVMTKEMAYIIKFVKAKLQCLIDILAIPENLKLISNRAKSVLEEIQQSLIYATEPAFCNKDSSTKDNSNPVIPINDTTKENIIKTLIDYNITTDGYIYNNPYDPFPYPNTPGTVIDPDETEYNENYLTINNITPGQQYEFRNIPTLFFDCNIPEPSLRPKFDIFTKNIPKTWSIYFSFKLTPEKLNGLLNFNLTIPITSGDNLVRDLLVQELSVPETTFDNPLTDLDINSIIEAAKLATEVTIPTQYQQKIEECSVEATITESESLTPCGYTSLEILNAELGNPIVNNNIIDFTFSNTGLDIALKNPDNPKFNLPIKLKIEKKFDTGTYNSDQSYNPEETTVILLIDFYNSELDLVNGVHAEYNRKPIFDANLYYGRYPFLEIGYRSNDGIYHFPTEFEIPDSNYLNMDILIQLSDIAIKRKKQLNADEYQPTPEQIAKKKEINLEKWNESTCTQSPETRQILENQKTVINDIIKPLLIDITEKMDDKAAWIIEKTPALTDPKIDQIINATNKVVKYGIPLVELNKDENICMQIVQIEQSPNVYKPMVNISNFNFLTNILNLDNQNNIPMIIEPNTTYFSSIVFDGSKYEFTLIDEKKVVAKLIKLKTTSATLFPTRFGRMTDPVLVDQTFCGTLFDLGITNTVINPEVYYKFSMLQFNPKSELFIDFELSIDNNFYSVNDLPLNLKHLTLSDQAKYWIEQTYLKGKIDKEIPYFIYNKYISAHSMNNELLVESNKYKNALREAFVTNFYCKETILNKSFTMSFWIKRIDDSLAPINPERMVLISDTKYFNNIYYNKLTTELIIELNNKNQIIKIPKAMNGNTWYNIVLKFDHLLNRLKLFVTSEDENDLQSLYVGSPISQFKFNLISLLAEFDFIKKDFSNYYPCLLGNVIMDMNYIGDDKLQEFFEIQKLGFKGL